MSPKRSDLVLSTDIPDIEFRVLVCHCLDVEAYCRYRCDVLVEFQLVQDC